MTTAKPAVRVEAAWKSPARYWKTGGREVAVGSFNYSGSVTFKTCLKIYDLTSRTMKNIRSTAFRRTSTQNSHQLALLGNRSVKHRRGWSSRKRSSSHMPLVLGTHMEVAHMTNRSTQGNLVLPMMIRKVPNNKGKTACWKEIIKSGVRVNPKSLNIEAGVKKPHHVGLMPTSSTMARY